MSFPIDAMHQTTKASRLLAPNNFLRRNFQKFSKLSPRECEVLKQLALGKSSSETGNELLFLLVPLILTEKISVENSKGLPITSSASMPYMDLKYVFGILLIVYISCITTHILLYYPYYLRYANIF